MDMATHEINVNTWVRSLLLELKIRAVIQLSQKNKESVHVPSSNFNFVTEIKIALNLKVA